MTAMDEQKKDTALDEEALEGVTGGGLSDWVNQAWAKIQENSGSKDNKEEQP